MFLIVYIFRFLFLYVVATSSFDLSFTKARFLFALTDYVPPEEWGPEYPIPGAIRPTVPIPTLYADGKWNIFIIFTTLVPKIVPLAIVWYAI